MLLLLVLIGVAIEFFGSFLVENLKGNVSFILYFNQVFDSIVYGDIIPATIKSFFFGLAIGIVDCYKGYYCAKRTEGIGYTANSAVVD
ncbi:ABC transporter permease [Winogradskyella bathintestinalis]|uniref:ABC transporter permease n=1 Tax=Winogradskyella bathintestinalis TaxID=3035208 RepID=UPI002961FBEF|nr:ABC transporter permease [Winogradskyella bathintestinalis]